MLIFTQGDDVLLNLKATNSDGVPVNLTGATFSTSVRGLDNIVVTFPNSQHTANPDQSAHRGEFTLSLSTTDTDSIKAGMSQEIVTKVTIAGKVVYFHGANQMTVLPADPDPEPDLGGC